MLPEFLDNPVEQVAERLLGCYLERNLDGQRLLVRITETEAYDQEDAAAHSFRGKTPRNEVMFGPSGRLYVYFTYGMHFCCNVVTGQPGFGSAVLFRAGEPVIGRDRMEANRGKHGVDVTNGPAKLCQALGIDLNLNGHDLAQEPLRLLDGELETGESISRSTRIGISRDTDLIRRYFVTDNPFVSRR